MKRCTNTEHSDIVNKWSTFHTLRSIGVYGKRSPVEHLRIDISCQCRGAPLYRPVLILTYLTGVSQWRIQTFRLGVGHEAPRSSAEIGQSTNAGSIDECDCFIA